MARKNKEDEDEYRLPAKTTSRKRPKTWAAHRTTSLRKALLTNNKKKEEARPVLEDDDHINEQYYADFRQHVVDLRAHLAGKWADTDELDENVEDSQPMEVHGEHDSHSEEEGEQPYQPFTVTNWTDQEKDTFFHAVATYSRLRPDLIAASIKTKNMYDVCLYMRFLDDSLERLREDELDTTIEAAATESEEGDESDDAGSSAQEEVSDTPTVDDDLEKPRAFESDASKKARRDAKLEAAALQHRNAAPRAMEMTVPWIEFEERLAKLLCNLEDDDQRRGGDVALASAVARERVSSGSPRKDSPREEQKFDKKDKGKGRARDDQEEQESPHSQRSASRTRSSPMPPSPSDKASTPSTSTSLPWKTANVYFLDGHLQALETILRDAEETRAAADLAGQSSSIKEKMRQRSRSQSMSRTAPPPANSGAFATSNGSAEASPSDYSASTTFRVVDKPSSTGARPTSRIHDDGRHFEDDVDNYILPRRGASSAEANCKSQLKSQRTSGPKKATFINHGEDEDKHDGDGDQGQDVQSEKEDKGEDSGEENEENEEERALKDPNLCPTIRRRFLNRIYMRKKRAMERGGLEAVEAVDTKSVRLKPGRKRRNTGSSSNSNSRATSVKAGKKRKRSADGDGDEDDNVDEERVDERDRKDRFWLDLEEAGIDEDVLTKEGMAYFNLSMLGKLLSYFTDGYRDRTIPGQPALSASLIRVMFTSVVEFLVDVIHRTVVLSESRSSVRTGSKVFRQNNDFVTVEDVKLALEIAGHPLEDRKTLLARLMRDKHAPPPPKGTIIQPTIPTSELAGMTFHRSLYLPFIQLPREYGGHEVGEEENDHVEGRGRRGYLAAMESNAVSEESVDEEHRNNEQGVGREDGEDNERRDRLRRKGKERAAEDVDMTDEEDHAEGIELLALCEDPILPPGTDDAEDEEYEKQMAEEEELDVQDTLAAKEFEQGVWDRTLEAGEVTVLPT